MDTDKDEKTKEKKKHISKLSLCVFSLRLAKHLCSVTPWSAPCSGQKRQPVFFGAAAAVNSPQRLGNSDGVTCGWPLRSAPAPGHRRPANRPLPLLCALPICPSEMFRQTNKTGAHASRRTVGKMSRQRLQWGEKEACDGQGAWTEPH